MKTAKVHSGSTRWQTVALPTEHGGWGFISEPVVLGVLLALTWGGLALSISAFAAFLLRHPLKLYLKDIRSGRSVPRTAAARRFVMIYGGVMIAAGLALLLVMPSFEALLPLAFSLPFLAAQLWQDVRSQGRGLLAELAGATAPGAIASAIVMIQGWLLLPALGLWLALAVKAITAVLYVRARLRLERGRQAASGLVVAAHGIGLAVLVVAAVHALLPWTAAAGMVVLTVRACLGLSALRKARLAKIIGLQEVAYGLGFTLLVALGYPPA